jgi:hypothetical protein
MELKGGSKVIMIIVRWRYTENMVKENDSTKTESNVCSSHKTHTPWFFYIVTTSFQRKSFIYISFDAT